ncbi:hypothetical protein B296_00029654 [Ensete ventricosum]|uniref:Uncharacterized protein n=1 Tax=Ensete ventricosum TaxID=4639 RepID=A0A426Z644_ENSVE|nr:hypothetical protein B296_00029654 [Ensete ventricosum]
MARVTIGRGIIDDSRGGCRGRNGQWWQAARSNDAAGAGGEEGIINSRDKIVVAGTYDCGHGCYRGGRSYDRGNKKGKWQADGVGSRRKQRWVDQGYGWQRERRAATRIQRAMVIRKWGGTVMSGNGEGRSKGKRCGYMAVASTFRATEAAVTRSNSDKHRALKRRRRTGN